MKLNLFFTALLFLSISFLKVSAQAGISPELSEKLQNSITSLRLSNKVKGIYAAVYIPGKGVWKGVTGVSYDTIPIDTTMLFSMGSITKTFVAAEIFKLIESGQLSLNDTIGALLPPLQYVNSSITIRQLLGHKSGLADFLNPVWESSVLENPLKVWNQREALDSFLMAPLAAPGSTWNYVNTNYALLGLIIESKRNTSLATALRNDLLSPLLLNNTYMDVFEKYSNSLAHNWSAENLDPALAQDVSEIPHTALWSTIAPAGGYMSMPQDLVQWGYNLYSGKVISAASLQEMLIFTNVNGGYFTGYGLGAMRFSGTNRIYWGHAGNFFGYAGCMLYDPKDSICVAVLVNQDCLAANIARPFMNTLLNTITTTINEEQENHGGITISPNPAYNEITISLPKNNAKQYTLKLTDNSGNVVYTTRIYNSEIRINTNEFPDGSYIAYFISATGTITQKLLIQH